MALYKCVYYYSYYANSASITYLVMVTLCNRADHYIFIYSLLVRVQDYPDSNWSTKTASGPLSTVYV